MNTAYLSIGSNIGNTHENLRECIAEIAKTCSVLKESSFIVTAPEEYTDQPDFLNGALVIETTLSPEELLQFVKETEENLGRIKTFRYGPRSIDIDIIFYNDLVFSSASLTIPHEKAHLREFVLKPISELNPDFMHPVYNKTVSELLEEL